MRPLPRLLYVAGYGRSGSTVLDIALSAHPAIEGFGELTGIFEELADRPAELAPDLADLGAAVERALTVAGVGTGGGAVEPSLADPAALASLVADVERLLPATTLLPRSRRRRRRRYLDAQRALLAELADRTGAAIVLDSSKSSWLHTWRLPLLGRLDTEIHGLVLVRPLPSVVGSVRGGRGDTQDRQRLPTTRAVIGWTLANATAVATTLTVCGRGRTRLVTHGELAARPGPTLEAIVAWLGLPPSDAIVDGVRYGFVPGHQLQGNRVRRQARIHLRPPSEAGPVPGLFRRPVVALVDRMVRSTMAALVPTLTPAERPAHPASAAAPDRDAQPARRSA